MRDQLVAVGGDVRPPAALPVLQRFLSDRIQRCTVMMQRIAAQLRADPFLIRMATPRTGNVDAKAYATDWYGLPRSAAMSVAIRRLIQAEHQLPAMIDAVIAGKAPPAMTILRSLPTYRRAKLGRLSVARQVELLAFYRGAVLADGNNNSL